MEFDNTISEIRKKEDLPESADELNFEAPWQARAFSIVLSLYQEGLFEWSEFQSRLIENVQSDDEAHEEKPLESVYYEQWMKALENLLVEKGICEPDEIIHRSEEFSTGERDASEFVPGVDHSHPH